MTAAVWGREHRCRNGEGIGHGRNGGFAEYVTVSQHSLVKLPDGLELTSAALLACPAGVALQALTAVEASAGETVVVTGAGGGLGVHAVQFAAALGARTLAVSSSPHKAQAIARYGADEVIEAGELDFAEIVMALTADEGADVVIDTVGAATLHSSLCSLAQYGRLALLGEVGGEGSLRGVIPEIVFRDARVMGVSGVSRSTLEQTVALDCGGEAEAGVAGGSAAGGGGAGTGDGGVSRRAGTGGASPILISLFPMPSGHIPYPVTYRHRLCPCHWHCPHPAVFETLPIESQVDVAACLAERLRSHAGRLLHSAFADAFRQRP